MRNKWILISAGIVALMFGVLAYFFLRPVATTIDSTNQGTDQFPTAGENQNGTGSISVAEIQQGSISVRNFKNDSTTVPDPVNHGFYYIAGGATPAITRPPYQVFYDETHQYFAIELYQEPLGAYRSEAEQILKKALNISNDDMCRLNYFVGVSKGVNDLFLAKNLGFSFCPGATALP